LRAVSVGIDVVVGDGATIAAASIREGRLRRAARRAACAGMPARVV